MTALIEPRRKERAGLDRRASMVLALVLAFVVVGCSSFQREWSQAAHRPAAENSIEGRWEGRWVSDVNGHDGRLQCLISHVPNDSYSARFRATFMKVLRFNYTVRLQVEHSDGAWRFHGEENLGKLAGGVYRYIGHATKTEFLSTYDSKYDHGAFEMRRLSGNAIPPKQ